MTSKAAKKKHRKSPTEIEGERIIKRAQDLEAVNLPPDAAILPRQAEIEVTRAGEKRTEAANDKKAGNDTARRHDAFSALKNGMARGCYDAARRFEADLLTRHGVTDHAGRGAERIDCTAGHTTDLMRTAGIMVDRVQENVSPRDFWLLCELIIPPIDRGTWRDHAAYITGERDPEGQASAVRAATVNLRDAYEKIEGRKAA